jgi:5,10-methylene-tetrahydrofolate dehydrogenase/methenyl tetrahydrofolate cyclohydrolase
MEKRLLKRGETSGRSDDNAESIKKRCAAEAALTQRTHGADRSIAGLIAGESPAAEQYSRGTAAECTAL